MNTYYNMKFMADTANATCPAWLVWTLVGIGVAFTVAAIVFMIKMWK